MHQKKRCHSAALSFAICAMGLTVGVSGFAQELPQRSISQISGNVYRAQNINHNTVFMVTPSGIILADPINEEFAEWLKGELQTRFDVPVRYVIYSHNHWDHASGGSVFAETANYIGHANMLNYLAMPPESTTLAEVVGQYAPVAALDANGDGNIDRTEVGDMIPETQFAAFDQDRNGLLSGAEVVRGPLAFVHPPNITYTDQIEIHLGGMRVVASWVGEMNHSFDVSRITFPDESVMFVVDYITFGRLPFREMDFENGMYQEWMAAIEATEELAKDFEYVTGGHGPLGNRESIAELRTYFQKLEDAVSQALAEGQTLEEMRAGIEIPEYAHWAGYTWLDENVLGMYHFLTD